MVEEMIKHIIEGQKQYMHVPLIGFDLEKALKQIAEAAKLEERKRIEEALSNTPEGSCFYCTRKRECRNPHDILTLDQVRSIINPK